MMSTQTTYYATEIDRLEALIEGYQGSLNWWADQEARFDSRAEDLYAVASAIETNIGPLPAVLQPVWNLHTTHTWEGNAASQSRTRLGIHSDRLSGAVTTLRALVTDLEAEAAAAASEANHAAGQVGSYRWRLEDAREDLRNEQYSTWD